MLTPQTAALFDRLPVYDQRHGVESAQALLPELDALAIDDPQPWLVAALLHDVGKYGAQLGPTRRACATVVGSVAGRGRTQAWSTRQRGVRARIGRYVEHDAIGARELRAAGAPEVAVQWAQVHHADPGQWDALGFPPGVARALDLADHA